MREQLLQDKFGRTISYLRISVTDRCDLRCQYCMPKGFSDFSEPENWLLFEEIERITSAFVQAGVRHVRLTGGEPLVRKNLPGLVEGLSSIDGLDDISISSNCTRMTSLAQPLFEAGANRLNVSLDTLDVDTFKAITAGKLEKVLSGIDAAKQAGFQPIRINTVVMKGINDNAIEDILEYCAENGFTLRLIETMPMGETGRSAVNQYISLQEIKKRLEKSYQLIPDILPGAGPARYYRLSGTGTHIGFITPMSQHFCETCNRVRLTVDGNLHMCLGQEHSYPLRDLIRSGISDDELSQHLIKALALKPERHEFTEKPSQVIRFMSMTGG